MSNYRLGFANAVSEDEAKELYSTLPRLPTASRCSKRRQANLNPWTEAAKLKSKNPDRGPLLILSGEKDNTVPWVIANASFKR